MGQSGSSSQGSAMGTSGQEPGAKAGKKASKSGAGADAAFVKKAAEGGLAEVELGKLATQKAASDDVKKFGQRMVDDHTKANDQLKSVASSKGIDIPSALSAKDEAMKSRLDKLDGAAFDRAYMSHMVQDQTKDVSEFSREAKAGKDAEVKSFASSTLPILEEHLKLAKSVDQTVKGSEAGGKAGKKAKKGSSEK
jgi:putative membrane protein